MPLRVTARVTARVAVWRVDGPCSSTVTFLGGSWGLAPGSYCKSYCRGYCGAGRRAVQQHSNFSGGVLGPCPWELLHELLQGLLNCCRGCCGAGRRAVQQHSNYSGGVLGPCPWELLQELLQGLLWGG